MGTVNLTCVPVQPVMPSFPYLRRRSFRSLSSFARFVINTCQIRREQRISACCPAETVRGPASLRRREPGWVTRWEGLGAG